MRRCKPIIVVVVLAMTGFVAAPALAGAPAFECRIGSTRIGLDSHRAVALVRRPSEPVTRFKLGGLEAAGADQRYRLTNGSVSAIIDVRGAGASASADRSPWDGGGACAFVPGDFAIGSVTASRIEVRTGPSPNAAVAVVLRRGSFVWLDLNGTAGTGGGAGMVRVRVVLRVRGGRIGGGDQQLGMGSAAGLDGRSTVIEGWATTRGIEWAGPPGP